MLLYIFGLCATTIVWFWVVGLCWRASYNAYHARFPRDVEYPHETPMTFRRRWGITRFVVWMVAFCSYPYSKNAYIQSMVQLNMHNTDLPKCPPPSSKSDYMSDRQ